jgi:predicted  nucleic acid-binding Zn-ribbon protein
MPDFPCSRCYKVFKFNIHLTDHQAQSACYGYTKKDTRVVKNMDPYEELKKDNEDLKKDNEDLRYNLKILQKKYDKLKSVRLPNINIYL